MTPTDTQVGDQLALGSSPDGDTQPVAETPVVSGPAPEAAECRGCGKALRGKPYYMGGSAYLPLSEGGGQAKVNFYGGFVCSRDCDYRASLRLEQTMPGHYGQTSLHPCSEAGRRVARAWGEQ